MCITVGPPLSEHLRTSYTQQKVTCKTCKKFLQDSCMEIVPFLASYLQDLQKFFAGHHKSVQISEFVRISEAQLLIYKIGIKHSNRTFTYNQNTLTEQSVVLFEGLDNQGPTVPTYAKHKIDT